MENILNEIELSPEMKEELSCGKRKVKKNNGIFKIM